MCAQCKKCFKDQKYLRKHMQDVHKLEPLSLSKEDYLELPSVESTLNRCLPCNKTFPNSLRYRIHIKDSHDKTEPVENYDAEKGADSQIDKKKEVENKETEEQDPLADPLDITDSKDVSPEDVSSKDDIESKTLEKEDHEREVEEEKTKSVSRINENENHQTVDVNKIDKEDELKDSEPENSEKSRPDEKKDIQEMEVDNVLNVGVDSKTKE